MIMNVFIKVEWSSWNPTEYGFKIIKHNQEKRFRSHEEANEFISQLQLNADVIQIKKYTEELIFKKKYTLPLDK
jgi:hypothetical protein